MQNVAQTNVSKEESNSSDSASNIPNKHDKIPQNESSIESSCDSSTADSDSPDDISEVSTFLLSEHEDVVLNNRFLLSGAGELVVGLDHEAAAHQAAHLDPGIQARLVALLEASDAYQEGELAIERLIKEGRTNDASEDGESLLSLACGAGYYDLAQVLIAMRANVEDRGFKGDCTPLMEAASAGHNDIVTLLISNKAQVNSQSASGNTPLMYACASGHTGIVKQLLNNGANVEDNNENGHTPLMEAASAGHVEVASVLLNRGAGINTSSNEFKESALTLACYKGHVEMVKFLLNSGADQDHKTDEMHTALMEACMDGHVEVAKLLLNKGAQVDMPKDSFESPLTLAACGGHVVLAHLLLETGANIEEVNDEGYTPLMEASREGHGDMVKLLIRKPVQDRDGTELMLNPNILAARVNVRTDETQETALTLACCGGFREVVMILVEQGRADMEMGSSTPLMEAAQEGHKDIVDYLIGRGADIHAQSTTGDTALSYACENGHTVVVESLLGQGADLEHPSEGGRTPLMKAARAGHTCTVQYLLQHGADPNRSTPDNENTPLALACFGGHEQIVDLLLSRGANPAHVLRDSVTMVMEAAKGGHAHIMKMLLAYPTKLPLDSAAKKASAAALPPSHQDRLHADAPSRRTDPYVCGGCGGDTCPPCTSPPAHPHPSTPRVCWPHDPHRLPAQPDLMQPYSNSQLHSLDSLATHTVETQTQHGYSNPPLHHHHHPATSAPNWLVVPAAVPAGTSTANSPATTMAYSSAYHQHQYAMDGGGGKPQPLDPGNINQQAPPHYTTTTTVPVSERKIMVPSKKVGRNKQIKVHQQFLCLQQDTQRHEHKVRLISQRVKEVFGGSPPQSAANTTNVVVSIAATASTMSTITTKKSNNNSNKRSAPVDCDCGGSHSSLQQQFPPDIDMDMMMKENMVAGRGCANNNCPTCPPDVYPQRQNQVMYSSSHHILEGSPSNTVTFNTLSPTELAVASSLPTSQHIQPQQQNLGSANTMNKFINGNNSTALRTYPQDLCSEHHSYLNEQMTSPMQMVIVEAEARLERLSERLDKVGQRTCSNKQAEKERLALSKELDEQFKLVNNNKQALHSYLERTRAVPTNKKEVHQLPPSQDKTSFAQDEQLKNSSQSVHSGSFQGLQHQLQLISNMLMSGGEHSHTTDSLVYSQQDGLSAEANQQVHQQSQLFDSAAAELLLPSSTVPTKVMASHLSHHMPLPDDQMKYDPNAGIRVDGLPLDPGYTAEELHSIEQEVSNSWPSGAGNNATIRLDNNNMANTCGEYMSNVRSNSPHACPPSSINLASTSNPHHSITERLAGDGSCSMLPGPQYTVPSTASNVGSEIKMHVDSKTESNRDTALTLGCAGGHSEMVELLLTNRADIEHRDKKGFTPLILAATGGHLECVQILLKSGANIEAQSERTKDTPLSLACSGGRLDVVELLLLNKANKEHRNVSDYTPLSLAASGGYVNIIKLLLDNNAEINSRTGSKLGISPLMLAAMNGHTSAVRLLLDSGSDINAQIETNRNTALTLACFQGRSEVVTLLLERKAFVEHRAKTGLTPLMEAASGGYVDVGLVLLNGGADVNALPVPSSRDTALTIAADKGHGNFVKLLIEKGAHVEVKNKKGNSPMWLAANGGHEAVVESLLLAGADIDSKDNRSVSCLMAAFKKAHVKVVTYMVSSDKVTQYPSDLEVKRFIQTVTDAELAKQCDVCQVLITAAKHDQDVEATKNANELLKEVQLEESCRKSKKEAANRRKQKRKLKKHENKVDVPRSQYDSDDDLPPTVPSAATTTTVKAATTALPTANNNAKKNSSVKAAHALQASAGASSSNNNNNTSSKSGGKKNSVSTNSSENNNHTRSSTAQDVERDSGTDSHSQTSMESKGSGKNKNANNNNSRNVPTTSASSTVSTNKSKKQKKKEAALAEEALEFALASSATNIAKPSVSNSPAVEIKDNFTRSSKNTASNGVNKNKTNISNNNSGKAAKSDNNCNTTKDKPRQPSPDVSLASLKMSTNNTITDASSADPKIKRENTKAQMNKSSSSSKKKQQKQQGFEGSVPASTTAISELDTFNDVSPDLLDRLSSMALSPPQKVVNLTAQSGTRQPVNGCYQQDSVASLDTFGEPLPTAIPDLMSTALLVPQPSPKKLMVMRGLNQPSQEGWKEVNRKGKKVTVDNATISRIIGRGGSNINAIREYSGAHIEVEKQGKTASRSINIKGSADAMHKAHNIITSLVEEPETELSDLIPKPAPPAASAAKLSGLKLSAVVCAVSQPMSAGVQPCTVLAPRTSAATAGKVVKTAVSGPTHTWALPASPVKRSAVPQPPTSKQAPPLISTIATTIVSSNTQAPKSPATRQLFSHQTEASAQNPPSLMKPLSSCVVGSNAAASLGPIGPNVQKKKQQNIAQQQSANAPGKPAKDSAGTHPTGEISSSLLQQISAQRPVVNSTVVTADSNPITAEVNNTSNAPPAFRLFDKTNPAQHNVVWGSKTDDTEVTNTLEPLSSLLVDKCRAPGYRVAATTAAGAGTLADLGATTADCSAAVLPATSIAARSAPGTPTAAMQRRVAAVTPPPDAANLSFNLLSRTPPPANLQQRPPPSTGGFSAVGRSFSPPDSGGFSPSLAVGGPTRTETAVAQQLRYAAMQQHALQQNNPISAEQQREIMQQWEQQQLLVMQQQNPHGMSINMLNMPNMPQFTTPHTNTQPVFTNNMHGPISATPQLQSNLNPDAPDFSIRANNFAASAGFSRPQVSTPYQANTYSMESLQQQYGNNMDVQALLQNSSSALVHSPHNSTPGSPTPAEIVYNKHLRPIGGERAHKFERAVGGNMQYQFRPPPPHHGDMWSTGTNVPAAMDENPRMFMSQQPELDMRQQNYANMPMWPPWNTDHRN